MSKFILELNHIEDAPLPDLLQLVTQAVTQAWAQAQANLTEPQPALLTVRGADGNLHSMAPPPTPPGECACPRCILRRLSDPVELGQMN